MQTGGGVITVQTGGGVRVKMGVRRNCLFRSHRVDRVRRRIV